MKLGTVKEKDVNSNVKYYRNSNSLPRSELPSPISPANMQQTENSSQEPWNIQVTVKT